MCMGFSLCLGKSAGPLELLIETGWPPGKPGSPRVSIILLKISTKYPKIEPEIPKIQRPKLKKIAVTAERRRRGAS